MMLKFAVFGIVGLAMEVFWTGLGSLKNRDFKATSQTSIWMFFIYGAAAFMSPLIELFSPMHWILRGFIYALIIFVIEYIAGIALKSAKICPWDYSHARYNVHGVIRLDYAPLWVIVGLVMEFIHVNYFG